MSSDFHLKQDDTTPAIEATLKDSNGNAVDLTGASAKFIMTQYGKTTAKVDASATVTDAANGKVRYSWQTGDTDTAGLFKFEWEVTYGNGKVETFPSESYMSLLIEEDLG